MIKNGDTVHLFSIHKSVKQCLIMEIKLTENTKKRLLEYLEFLELFPEQFYDVVIKTDDIESCYIELLRKDFVPMVTSVLVYGYYREGSDKQKMLNQLEKYYQSWISGYKNN